MGEITGVLPGLPAICGKPVHVAFDGGQLTSDAGVLVLAEIDRRLRISERLAGCLEDRRDPERVRHSYAEMIRFLIKGLPGNGAYTTRWDTTNSRTAPKFEAIYI